MTAGGDEQQKHVADDEGRDEEGGEGEGNGDEGGGRATATMVKKRARAARLVFKLYLKFWYRAAPGRRGEKESAFHLISFMTTTVS